MKNKVSIGIATYNHAEFLEKAILTSLNQTYQNVEIIIIDDCSSDDTQKVISKFIPHPKLVVHKNVTNLGIAKNYNKIIDLATGDFFFILGDDDFIADDYVEKMLIQFQKNENCVAVFGKNIVINENEEQQKILVSKFETLSSINYLKCWLSKDKIVNQHSVIMMFVKTEALRIAGKFPLFPMAQHADNALFMNICIGGDIAYVSDTSYYYRVYANSYGNKNVIEVAHASSEFITYFNDKIYERIIKIYGIETANFICNRLKVSLVKEFNSRLAKFYSRDNNLFSCFKLIINVFPFWKEKYFYLYDFLFKYMYIKLFSSK